MRLPDRASPVSLFLFFAALSSLTRALLFVAPPLSDEPVHLLGSWVWQHGGRLYVDFVDNKPPLLYAYYALAQLPFDGGLSAVRLVTVLAWIPLTALAASAYYAHRPAGVVAGTLYLVAAASFVIDEGLAVNTEVLMLLPAALAFVSLVRMRELDAGRRALVAGAWLGIAALFKVTAVLWLPAIPAMAWRIARPGARWSAATRATGLALAGLSLPLAAAALAFHVHDSARELVEWSLLRNLAYVAAPVEPAEAFKRAATGAVGWMAVTLPLWWTAWRPLPRPSGDVSRWLAAALALLAMPAVVMGWRFFAHYYLQVLFPLCLAAAPVVAGWLEPLREDPASTGSTPRTSAGDERHCEDPASAGLTRARPPQAGGRRVVGAWFAWMATAFAAFALFNAWVVFGRNDVLESRRHVYNDVAAWLRSDLCAEPRTLFVWGREPMFYVASRLRPASRFVLPQETLSGYVPGRQSTSAAGRVVANTGRDWDTLMADLERSRATYVLDTAPSGLHGWGVYKLWNYPRLFLYLRDHYDQAAVIDNVVVYRRRDCR